MKLLHFMILVILSLPLITAQPNLYQLDSLEVRVDVTGGFELIPEKSSAKVKEVNAELLLFPTEDFRQKIIDIEHEGEKQNNKLLFDWNDGQLGEKEFGYSANIRTENERIKVTKRIPFPLTDISGYEQYTLPSPKIDSDNPKIAAKAAELAGDEKDLFKVVFNIADWVEENIEYDLNELTTDQAQKASWVLDNRQGVCDEMTSLFVAMVRSLGIPARFVSGISYSEHPDIIATLGNPWAGHGWAEVYFPEIGWVSFDIAFNEFGYVDVTHIKLREGLDPDEPATRYEWTADSVKLDLDPLEINAQITNKGSFVPEEILLEQEIIAEEVGFGSYNIVKGIVKNKEDYYVATTLQLAAPDEVTIEGKNKRKILLAPREIKETSWIIKIPSNLKENYQYNFPMIIYSEKNISVERNFIASQGKNILSRDDIEELIINNEEKTYSRKIFFDCNYPPQFSLQQQAELTCTIKNGGSQHLDNLNLCLDGICEITDLAPGEEKSSSISLQGEKVGWHTALVSAENDLVEKKLPLTYVVLDKPLLEATVNYPQLPLYNQPITITLNLHKKSFSPPTSLIITLQGPSFENKWEFAELTDQQKLQLHLQDPHFGKNNQFTLLLSWKDQLGNEYTTEENFIITARADSFSGKIEMLFNGILNKVS